MHCLNIIYFVPSLRVILDHVDFVAKLKVASSLLEPSGVIRNHPESFKVIQRHQKSFKVSHGHPEQPRVIQSHSESPLVIQSLHNKMLIIDHVEGPLC